MMVVFGRGPWRTGDDSWHLGPRPRQTRVWGGFLNGGTAHGLPAAGLRFLLNITVVVMSVMVAEPYGRDGTRYIYEASRPCRR
jgi:hypothetical protein